MVRVCVVVGIVVCALGGALLQVGAGSDEEGPPEFVEWDDVCFPHRMHFEDLEIECESCHHETSAAALNIPHEEYFTDLWIDCTTCHKPGAPPATSMGCSRCHHNSPTDIADETLGSKVVIHESCWNCHEVATGVEASRACKSCHSGKHLHSSPARSTGRPRPSRSEAGS